MAMLHVLKDMYCTVVTSAPRFAFHLTSNFGIALHKLVQKVRKSVFYTSIRNS